ncbi:MAG: vanadium-dependent haloperoxidase [Ginsengibacter sp.]
MKKTYKRLILLISLVMIIGTGCHKQDAIIPGNKHPHAEDSYVIQTWYGLMMKLLTETPGHVPPVAARDFGYTGVALYESLVGDIPGYHSLAGQLSGLTSLPQRGNGQYYNATLTANAALAEIIRNLFQNASVENFHSIDALEKVNSKLYEGEQLNKEIIDRSREYGRAIAEAVFRWSVSDGGHRAYLNNFPADYIPPLGIDKWVPAPPEFQSAMVPYWGNNRSMVLANGPGPVDAPGPPSFSITENSVFYNAAYEVYNTGLHLSPEQKTIALYWADGANTFTPPGHDIAITLQMIRNRNSNLYKAAVLLAKVGIAENDAGIACWRAKYKANLLRPITFIQSYIDPSWSPLLVTPPFPTYTSGHSTFSGAASTILSAEIGDNFSFTDSTKIYDGFQPRSFNSFIDYAGECAISRLYGGIHYVFDNINGFNCGQHVAKNVEHLRWK